jgi:hypothetical protein
MKEEIQQESLDTEVKSEAELLQPNKPEATSVLIEYDGKEAMPVEAKKRICIRSVNPVDVRGINHSCLIFRTIVGYILVAVALSCGAAFMVKATPRDVCFCSEETNFSSELHIRLQYENCLFSLRGDKEHFETLTRDDGMFLVVPLPKCSLRASPVVRPMEHHTPSPMEHYTPSPAAISYITVKPQSPWFALG